MRAGIAVIGANYGDEGKGLLTDFITSQLAEECSVVRFNGGAQAGHTVVTPDGIRHVFSHIGAGSFSGCPTYLSQFFVVNPRLFVKEVSDLTCIGIRPLVSIDPRCLVTTPIDILVNQALERKRGTKRHGSCGVGINETVTRCLRSTEFATQAQELLNLRLFERKLLHLFRNWLPQRLVELNIDLEESIIQESFNQPESIASKFICECESLLNASEISFRNPDTRFVVFEGAQGLMLDENRLDQFPHVTRSKTGLENIVFLFQKFGLEELQVNYVTRTYLTKHGAGPLPGECSWRFPDATNVPNPYQGSLRYAPLNIDNLNYSIDLDLKRGKYLFPNLSAGIAFTCTDQLEMPDMRELPLAVNIVSHGPSRGDIEVLNGANYLKSALKPISRARAVLRA